MPAESIVVSRSDGVLTLTISNSARMNAVDAAALHTLADAIESRQGDDRVIVLRGEGRGFCAGADLDLEEWSEESAAATLEGGNRVVAALTASPLPSIAAVHGPCAGLGVSIALSADLTVAAESAFFQLAFARIGLMPDAGATALVAASIGRARALRLSLTGERFSAVDAATSGLIGQVVADAAFEAEVTHLIELLRDGPAAAFAQTKHAINAATLTQLDAAFGRERAGQLPLLASADFREGVAAFTQKRRPQFTDSPGAPGGVAQTG